MCQTWPNISLDIELSEWDIWSGLTHFKIMFGHKTNWRSFEARIYLSKFAKDHLNNPTFAMPIIILVLAALYMIARQ